MTDGVTGASSAEIYNNQDYNDTNNIDINSTISQTLKDTPGSEFHFEFGEESYTMKYNPAANEGAGAYDVYDDHGRHIGSAAEPMEGDDLVITNFKFGDSLTIGNTPGEGGVVTFELGGEAGSANSVKDADKTPTDPLLDEQDYKARAESAVDGDGDVSRRDARDHGLSDTQYEALQHLVGTNDDLTVDDLTNLQEKNYITIEDGKISIPEDSHLSRAIDAIERDIHGDGDVSARDASEDHGIGKSDYRDLQNAANTNKDLTASDLVKLQDQGDIHIVDGQINLGPAPTTDPATITTDSSGGTDRAGDYEEVEDLSVIPAPSFLINDMNEIYNLEDGSKIGTTDGSFEPGTYSNNEGIITNNKNYVVDPETGDIDLHSLPEGVYYIDDQGNLYESETANEDTKIGEAPSGFEPGRYEVDNELQLKGPDGDVIEPTSTTDDIDTSNYPPSAEYRASSSGDGIERKGENDQWYPADETTGHFDFTEFPNGEYLNSGGSLYSETDGYIGEVESAPTVGIFTINDGNISEGTIPTIEQSVDYEQFGYTPGSFSISEPSPPNFAETDGIDTSNYPPGAEYRASSSGDGIERKGENDQWYPADETTGHFDFAEFPNGEYLNAGGSLYSETDGYIGEVESAPTVGIFTINDGNISEGTIPTIEQSVDYEQFGYTPGSFSISEPSPPNFAETDGIDTSNYPPGAEYRASSSGDGIERKGENDQWYPADETTGHFDFAEFPNGEYLNAGGSLYSETNGYIGEVESAPTAGIFTINDGNISEGTIPTIEQSVDYEQFGYTPGPFSLNEPSPPNFAGTVSNFNTDPTPPGYSAEYDEANNRILLKNNDGDRVVLEPTNFLPFVNSGDVNNASIFQEHEQILLLEESFNDNFSPHGYTATFDPNSNKIFLEKDGDLKVFNNIEDFKQFTADISLGTYQDSRVLDVRFEYGLDSWQELALDFQNPIEFYQLFLSSTKVKQEDVSAFFRDFLGY